MTPAERDPFGPPAGDSTCLDSPCVSCVRSALSERNVMAAAEADVHVDVQRVVTVQLVGELVGGVVVVGPVHEE